MKLSHLHENVNYYHGTSDVVEIENVIRPSSETGRLQEFGRKKNLDKVFVTRDIGSARIYAGRAVNRFGGNPVIYRVAPHNVEPINENPGTTVYKADWAEVIEQI